jgi:hypothetical protein
MEQKPEPQRISELMSRFEQLKSIRRPFELLWDEEIEFAAYTMRPVRYYQNYQWQQGTRTGTTVYDGTALSAINLMADGFQGYIVGRPLKWFSLRLPHKISFSRVSLLRQFNGKRLDQVPEVREWLNQKEEVMYSAFQRSNFYDILGRWIRDCAVIGTSWLYSEEDLNAGMVSFQVLHPRQCFIAENVYGKVDTIFRKYRLNLRQMVQKWGMECLDIQQKKRYEKSPYDEVDIVHAIYPRDEIEMYQAAPGKYLPKMDKKNKPYASVWMQENKKDKFLEESGFSMLPIQTWRWELNTGEIYGYGPCAEALVDIITANQIAKDLMIASQLAAMPMYNVPEEMRGMVNVRPKAFNYFKDPARVISQIDNRANVPIAKDREEMIKNTIKEKFHVDFFMMLTRAAFDKVELTATQVMEMMGEKAAVLGAKIGRFESEGLDQVIDRVDMIETEAGRMPPPPQVLQEFQGREINVDYVGPLAQTQKALFRRQGATAALESVRPWLEMFPKSGVVINSDVVVRDLLEDTDSFPSNAIRSEEEVAEIEKQEQMDQQKQMALQVADRVGQHANKLGKAPEPGSIMEKMMGQAGNA